MNTRFRKLIESVLDKSQIALNGEEPQDMRVHDDRVFRRIATKGNLGLGESYMDGWWDVPKLDDFVYRLLRSQAAKGMRKSWGKRVADLQASLLNMQSRLRARWNIEKHYDIGNELYMSFLDPYNQYTCGYFAQTDDLNQAQEDKLDLICKKLDIKPSDHVLDIGCGWGGFAKFAAERYGCLVTGITISDEQLKYARNFCKGLAVKIKKIDYRDLSGKFDKVLICGMIEHVGYKNYRNIMEVVRRVLKERGKFLLHTIGGNTSSKTIDPWISKYIFPNAMLPSVEQIAKASEGLFVMEDWQNFGAYYDQTLMAWYDNFKRNWSDIKSQYDERFYRMWEYYLLSCAGSFRARENQLWQIVFTPQGDEGVFKPYDISRLGLQPAVVHRHPEAVSLKGVGA